MHVAGAALHMPVRGAILEPLSALGHILVGAPDHKIAIISSLCWLIVITVGIATWHARRRRSRASWAQSGLRGLFAGVIAVLLFALYGAFAALVPLPNWVLTVQDPNAFVADLHSHSLLSHDGIATFTQNLEMHRARGYDVVAFTEHYDRDLPNHLRSYEASPPGHWTAFLPGTERKTSHGLEFLAVGLPSDAQRPPDLLREADVHRFIEFVHGSGGAVIALAFKLHAADIPILAELGVDGFEIANAGHPAMSEAVRAALIRVQARSGLPLVADTDWHGWSGFLNAWTIVTPHGTGTPAAAVLRALRRHEHASFQPVVANLMGVPSPARAVFAPFCEALRYAGEITMPQLVSWWAWVLVLILLSARLRQIGVQPASCFLAAILLILGGGLTVRGVEIAQVWFSAATPYVFSLQVGAAAIAVGAVVLLIASVLISRLWRSTQLVLRRPVSRQLPARAE